MPITDWPASERPREKLLERGAPALSDAELLAIFLRTGVPGKSAVDLARELLARFGSLRKLLQASQHEFCDAKGLGTAKYIQLQAVLEMARRHLQEHFRGRDALSDPAAVRQLLLTRLRDYDHEVFAALYLDTRNQLLAFEELTHGTLDGAHVYVREVARRALHHNAKSVIFAHNHPSGVAEPSSQDRHLTTHLQQALALLEIRVLDHFVVGDGSLVSFAERGWI